MKSFTHILILMTLIALPIVKAVTLNPATVLDITNELESRILKDTERDLTSSENSSGSDDKEEENTADSERSDSSQNDEDEHPETSETSDSSNTTEDPEEEEEEDHEEDLADR